MNQSRIDRERKTIKVMISIYCALHHKPQKGSLCAECAVVDSYARERIEKCPLTADKPTCLKCPVHCYKADMKERVRKIMRFSGPRMLIRHPVLTLFHVLDGLKR